MLVSTTSSPLILAASSSYSSFPLGLHLLGAHQLLGPASQRPARPESANHRPGSEPADCCGAATSGRGACRAPGRGAFCLRRASCVARTSPSLGPPPAERCHLDRELLIPQERPEMALTPPHGGTRASNIAHAVSRQRKKNFGNDTGVRPFDPRALCGGCGGCGADKM